MVSVIFQLPSSQATNPPHRHGHDGCIMVVFQSLITLSPHSCLTICLWLSWFVRVVSCYLRGSVCCRVLRCTMVDSLDLYGVFPAYKVFNGMLLVLQALHIFWFYLILRMLHQYVIKGQVRKMVKQATTNTNTPEPPHSSPEPASHSGGGGDVTYRCTTLLFTSPSSYFSIES